MRDHPLGAIGGLYMCAKFGCNRLHNVEDMQVSMLREFGLKTPIHCDNNCRCLVHSGEIQFLGIMPERQECLMQQAVYNKVNTFSPDLFHQLLAMNFVFAA